MPLTESTKAHDPPMHSDDRIPPLVTAKTEPLGMVEQSERVLPAPPTDAKGLLAADRQLEKRMQEQYDRGFAAGKKSARRWATLDLEPVGKGSFGKVEAYRMQRTVYKIALEPSTQALAVLLKEFKCLAKVYEQLGGIPKRSHTFTSPRPYELFDPFRSRVYIANLPPGDKHDDVAKCDSIPAVSGGLWDSFESPTVSMDMIPALHPAIGDAYRSLFFRGDLEHEQIPIKMLRLYLGSTLQPFTTTFEPESLTSDFPLDATRYQSLCEYLDEAVDFPDPATIAGSMGYMLASLHYGVGIDGSDIELVLAGDHFHGLQCYVFDYNQCHQWLPDGYRQSTDIETEIPMGPYKGKTIVDGAQRLAIKIHGQEFYYPRPIEQPELYPEFARGYRRGAEHASMAEPVLDVIAPLIVEAADAFLAEYERLDKERAVKEEERLERRHRSRAVVAPQQPSQ